MLAFAQMLERQRNELQNIKCKHEENELRMAHEIDQLRAALDDARSDGRRSIIAKLAYWHGGHNASENSWGRLGMQVDVEDDEAVAKYFYKEISADARKPLEAEIVTLKARLFDL
jgi:hypothetical protein